MPLDADDALVPPPDTDAVEFDATAAPPVLIPPGEEAPAATEKVSSAPEEAPPEFDPRHRDPFVGLLFVGRLENTFTVFGHRFRIVTPARSEKIEAGLLIRPYQETVSAEIAWQTAMVAAYLTEVDGEGLPEPVTTNPKESAYAERYRWVSENLLDPVIDEVYTRCLELDGKVRAALEAMGKASG